MEIALWFKTVWFQGGIQQILRVDYCLKNYLKCSLFFIFLFFFVEEISPMPPSSISSGFSDDDSLRCDSSQSLTISQFVEIVVKKKRAGLFREYEEIKSRSPVGTFNAARYLILMILSSCS